MKLIALLFAILAAVPQALKWMAYGFGRMGGCTLPAATGCEIGGNDQTETLMKLWNPNWFNTTGLWIGGAGLVASLVVMRIMTAIDDRRSRVTLDRADRRSGVGHGHTGSGRSAPDAAPRTGTNGRMPRPPAFDRHGRPRI